jgi:hypothetical protein
MLKHPILHETEKFSNIVSPTNLTMASGRLFLGYSAESSKSDENYKSEESNKSAEIRSSLESSRSDSN